MSSDFSTHKNIISRSIIVYCLFWVSVRGLSHTLPPQLEQPLLKRPVYDIAFWIYGLSGLSDLLTRHLAISWFILGIFLAVSLYKLLKPSAVWSAVAFTLGLLIIDVSNNFFVGHSMHYMAAMVVISFALWGKSGKSFSLLWNGARYYACWLYFSAFLWKLTGSMWQWDAGIISVKSNMATYLYLNPDSNFAHFIYWFIEHPFWVNAGHKIVMLAEGLFGLGFITRRFDKLLIGCAIFIFTLTTLFSDVFFAEQLIIIFTFISTSQWQRLKEMLNRKKVAATTLTE